jgi:hypothetical protein
VYNYDQDRTFTIQAEDATNFHPRIAFLSGVLALMITL